MKTLIAPRLRAISTLAVADGDLQSLSLPHPVKDNTKSITTGLIFRGKTTNIETR